MRSIADPSYAGAFFRDRLMDPWAEGDGWCSVLACLSSRLHTHLIQRHTADDAVQVDFKLGQVNDADNPEGLWDDEGRQTYAYHVHDGDNRGVWIQLVDESHKRPGLCRTAWLKRRDHLLVKYTDIIEIDLLRSGLPVHSRPAGAAWSICCHYPWSKTEMPPVIMSGGLREPIPPMDFVATGAGRYNYDVGAVLAEYAQAHMFARHACYDKTPIAIDPSDAPWIAERVAAWLAAGGEAVDEYDDMDCDVSALTARYATPAVMSDVDMLGAIDAAIAAALERRERIAVQLLSLLSEELNLRGIWHKSGREALHGYPRWSLTVDVGAHAFAIRCDGAGTEAIVHPIAGPSLWDFGPDSSGKSRGAVEINPSLILRENWHLMRWAMGERPVGDEL